MSLPKLGLLCAVAGGYYFSWLPPTPPPEAEEQNIAFGKTWRDTFVVSMMRFIRLAPTALLLTEAAAVASTFSPATQQYTAKLMLGGNVSNIMLSAPFAVGSALIAVGAYIRYKCYKTLGEFFTFELAIRNNHKLVTWGPYGIVRHPSYSALMMVTTGLALCQATKGSWLRESGVLKTPWGAAIVGLYGILSVVGVDGFFIRMKSEDDALRGKFPKEWDSWAQKVPKKIIPGIY